MHNKRQIRNRGLVGLLDQPCLDSLSETDLSTICHSLSLVLTHAFTMIGGGNEMYNWSVENLDAKRYTAYPSKMTLEGNISWLQGGGTCRTYQADIAINSRPLLYSFKLIDSDGIQRFFLRKSYDGWTTQLAL